MWFEGLAGELRDGLTLFGGCSLCSVANLGSDAEGDLRGARRRAREGGTATTAPNFVDDGFGHLGGETCAIRQADVLSLQVHVGPDGGLWVPKTPFAQLKRPSGIRGRDRRDGRLVVAWRRARLR